MTDLNETPTSQDEEKKPLSPEESIALEHQRLQQEIELHKEKYLRSLAELENTRKRMQKERQEMTKFAVDTVIVDFLDPLDSLEKALSCTSHMSAETRNWAIGFKMILSQLSDVLTQHGVAPFESEGQQFDPHLHEAVSVEETDEVKEGYIIEQFARGYKSGDRILRPARVKVAKKLQTAQDSAAQEDLEEKPL